MTTPSERVSPPLSLDALEKAAKERPLVLDGHLFAPYPMSTGEPWCKFCGLSERNHSPTAQTLDPDTLLALVAVVRAVTEYEQTIRSDAVEIIVDMGAGRNETVEAVLRGYKSCIALFENLGVAAALAPFKEDARAES